MNDIEALHAKLKALSRSIDALVIDGVPRQNKKATTAMLTLLRASAVADDLYRALIDERTATQLARLAYMDAAYGCDIH